jgi:hypothetical protein
MKSLLTHTVYGFGLYLAALVTASLMAAEKLSALMTEHPAASRLGDLALVRPRHARKEQGNARRSQGEEEAKGAGHGTGPLSRTSR